jgi:hypothetical protein
MTNYKMSAKLNAIAGSLNMLDLSSLMPTFHTPRDKEKISDSNDIIAMFNSYPTCATIMCIMEASDYGGDGKIDTVDLESADDTFIIHNKSPSDKVNFLN